jgi:hypothetical protein
MAQKLVRALGNVEADRLLYTSGSEFPLDADRADAAAEAGLVEIVEDESASLERNTVPVLKDLAKERGVKGADDMKKNELIKALGTERK